MGGSEEPFICKLGELYPFHSIFIQMRKDEVIDFASKLSIELDGISSDERQLYEMAMSATVGDNKDFLHPIRYYTYNFIE